jgi:hypothetical protein
MRALVRFLFYLLVNSIKLADSGRDLADTDGDFSSTVEQRYFARSPEMKTLTLLVPFGPELRDISSSVKDYAGLDPNTFELLQSEDRRGWQIYKRLNDQVVLCVSRPLAYYHSAIRSLAESFTNYRDMIQPVQSFFPPSAANLGVLSARGSGSSRSGNSGSRSGAASGISPSRTGGGSGFSASKSATSPSAASGVTVNAQTVKIPVVDRSFCRSNVAIVPAALTAGEVRNAWTTNDQIALRSAFGIFEYLGRQLVAPQGGNLFQLPQASAESVISIDYNGKRYGVPPATEAPWTLQILSWVNEIVNANKVAGDIPVTRQVEIVP